MLSPGMRLARMQAAQMGGGGVHGHARFRAGGRGRGEANLESAMALKKCAPKKKMAAPGSGRTLSSFGKVQMESGCDLLDLDFYSMPLGMPETEACGATMQMQ